MPIKGSVTINITDMGTAALIPPLGTLDRNVQWMQWTLVAPANYRFAEDPIVFQETDLPPGYVPWSPPGTTPEKEDDYQVRAKANNKVPEGQAALRYRYDIYVDITTSENGQSVATRTKLKTVHPETSVPIDPDMENEPEP